MIIILFEKKIYYSLRFRTILKSTIFTFIQASTENILPVHTIRDGMDFECSIGWIVFFNLFFYLVDRKCKQFDQVNSFSISSVKGHVPVSPSRRIFLTLGPSPDPSTMDRILVDIALTLPRSYQYWYYTIPVIIIR